MNFCQQGLQAEQWFSRNFPSEIPLLISSKVSRRCGIKQVDLSHIDENHIILWEVKYSAVSENLASARALTFKEKRKWLRTRAFLSVLFERRIFIKVALVLKKDGNFFAKNHILV